MQVAPEIVAGKEHDFAVDVWGLGKIVLELLALMSSSELERGYNTLRLLGESMLQDAPEARPTIDSVYESVEKLIKKF